MKYWLKGLLVLWSLGLQGQYNIKGKVSDQSGQALPFVNIIVDGGSTGTTTDIDGRFSLFLNEKPQTLRFSYVGFEPLVLRGSEINRKLKVQMIEKVSELNEVTVLPGENPAHRIIKKAVAFRDENDPENLESFQYKTYSKFWVTLDIDSLDPKIDTVFERLDKEQLLKDSAQASPDSVQVVDSSDFKMHQFLSKQHLFFMETVTERRYNGSRDNETVLAQRTSGFKNPMFALLVTQLQSFSFYQDYIGITGDQYLNPLTRGSVNRYFFLLEDTIINNPGDTTYFISFRPRPNRGFKAMKGVLAINTEDWAIANVRAQPAAAEALPVEIRQEYRRFGDGTWFPVSFEADIRLSNVSLNDAVPEAVMRRNLSEIELNPNLRNRDINPNSMVIEERPQEEVTKTVEQFRSGTLDSVESETYRFIDSLSEAENIERNLEVLLALARGYVTFGKINLDLNRLLNYNTYEGLRLGLGITTNRRFSEWLELGGYFAYGFGDQRSKYGLSSKVLIDKNRRFSWQAGFQYDIFETGGFEIPLYEPAGLLNDNYRRLLIEQWDYSQRWFTGFQIDPLSRLRLDLRLMSEERRTVGDYRFNPVPDDATTALDREPWQFTELQGTLRFAPEEENAITPFGKIALKGGFPVFHLSYARGLEDFLEGDFDYHRLQIRMEHRLKTLRFGVSNFMVRAGALWGEVPAAKAFFGTANAVSSNKFYQRSWKLADRNSFETMRFNEFLSDRYLEIMWRQDFKTLIFKRENFAPHIELLTRMAIGDLRQPNLHENIRFRTLENAYWESGLELNRLYASTFFGFGLGFYYRYGAYQFGSFENNFAIKLTSKFVL